nr:MAG TPA: hypothetical protein [Caudoviricetes sp.]
MLLYQDRALLDQRTEIRMISRSLFSFLAIRYGSRYMVCSLDEVKKTKSMINRSRLNVPSED